MNAKLAIRMLLCIAVALLAAFLTQLTPVSPRRLLVGGRVLTGPELISLEIVAALIASLIVTGICLAIFRRPYAWKVLVAVVAQMLVTEWAFGFRQGGDTLSEIAIRYSSDIGAILGAVLMFATFHRLSKKKESVKPAS